MKIGWEDTTEIEIIISRSNEIPKINEDSTFEYISQRLRESGSYLHFEPRKDEEWGN